MDANLERFLKYVKIDTQSDENSTTAPSTSKQYNLLNELKADLKQMGIDSEITEHGVLYAVLKGEDGLDKIGLNAHVDTALEVSGANVKPQIIKNYDGGIIKLNDTYSMSPADFPTLGKHIGNDLVVTSGDTLLGADDKAGVAVIMAVLAHYTAHPEEKHHTICVCFTPDEEIGRGPDHFDAKRFGADFAYTIDGSEHDEIAIENFNAAHADVTISGVSIHPGEAKGKMINAASVACEFDRMLSPTMRPEHTENREGFNHLNGIEGSVDEARLHYIIRNHDPLILNEQKKSFYAVAKALNQKYKEGTVKVEIGDDYRNMKEILDKDPRAVDKIVSIFEKLGIEPKFNPIRGGTDGATFSFKGCPTPNLGTGSYNHHGRFEYLSVNEFNKMIEIVIELMKA